MSEISSSRFSTEDFAPLERVAVWREAYGRTVAKLELEPLSEGPFRAEAKLHAFDGLGLVSMATDKLRFAKPSSLINSDDLIVVTVESGGWVASQLGRETCLGPGEASICWNAEIAEGTTWGKRSMIRVPTQAIRPLVGDITAGVSGASRPSARRSSCCGHMHPPCRKARPRANCSAWPRAMFTT